MHACMHDNKNKRRRRRRISVMSPLILFLLLFLFWSRPIASIDRTRPNVLVFLADDLGVGDVGCFGNATVDTPNIDRLCQRGVKLNHHLANENLCTPSRAAFLTGRYPPRTGLTADASAFNPPVAIYVAARSGLSENETTWANVLKRNGYDTAAVGKWHLGWDRDRPGDQKHGPLGHGFDTFFGLPHTLVDGYDLDLPFFTLERHGWREIQIHSGAILALLFLSLALNRGRCRQLLAWRFGLGLLATVLAMWFCLEHFNFLHRPYWYGRSVYMDKRLNSLLVENTTVVEQPIRLDTLTDRLTDKAVGFLEKAARSRRPFGLYLAFPNVHTPLRPGARAKGRSRHGNYGDSLLEMDSAIGRVLQTLEDLSLSENTLVYFTSDHGCHINIGAEGGSNRPFRGGKGVGVLEGALRVPGVVSWPGVIPEGVTVHAPTSLFDWLPTLQEILREEDTSANAKIDGKSMLPLLLGKDGDRSAHRLLRHYCGTSLQAIRLIEEDTGDVYKAHFLGLELNDEGHCGYTLCPCFGDRVRVHRPPLVYDINRDPEERRPLQEFRPEKFRDLLPTLERAYREASEDWLPPSQLVKARDVLPRPWMQPCANFPLCRT